MNINTTSPENTGVARSLFNGISRLQTMLAFFVVVLTIALTSSRPGFAQSTVRMAIFGDQGVNGNARAVIELAKRESADLILVLGDLAYEQDTPDNWLAQYDEIVGSNFPILAVVGNHEEDRWPRFKQLLNDRLAQTPGVVCQGDYGVKNVCRFRGVTIVGAAPGISEVPGVNGNDDYAGYIRDVLAADNAPFSLCAWHKNMRDMQLGNKGDATGWDVYEACRENGAMVVTGHEHSYSRTHLMSSFEHLAVLSRSNNMTLTSGTSVGLVSGLGGVSAREQLRSGDWWASVYTADQNATRGSLFCDFGINGSADKASCYFKNIQNEVIDRFDLRSAVNGGDDGFTSVVRRVASSADDAEEQISTGDTYVLSSDLELIEERNETGEGRGPQQVGLRFRNITVPRGAQVRSAFLKFETDEPADRQTNLRIFGEADDSSAAFTENAFNISRRARTNASVAWNNLPVTNYNDSLRSPDLKSVIQEIVNRPGWRPGGPLSLLITGSGQRIVESFDGEARAAASLYIGFSSEPDNTPSSFRVSDVSVGESAGVARVVVTANPAPTQESRIWIATKGASAEAGKDFYGTSEYLRFPVGVTQQSIDVSIVNDTQGEASESFVARIFDPDRGTVSRAQAQITILDDDQNAKELIVADATVNEGDGDINIRVTLSPAATTAVNVEVSTSPETAINGSDFYGNYQRLRFAAGETQKNFKVTIVDDLVSEAAPEFFNVRLFNPDGATIVKGEAKINIVDND